MREIRQSGSEGGEAGTKPAFPTPIGYPDGYRRYDEPGK